MSMVCWKIFLPRQDSDKGAAAVVPDQVTEVLLGVYTSLASPQQQLTFFTLLAREFGVQGEQLLSALLRVWCSYGRSSTAVAGQRPSTERADLSAAGLERSCGLMVNYKYVLADVSANNRAYLVDHKIAAAEEVQQLLLG
ncbi:hypothetical protein COO60DRAFT_1627215 [Scenedesmus sp. NREL 46B-D3]|nr:hypothetical protein COO60DRAFT_1627215 [Scenedesmus sp. NREL 46B-D3]